MSCCTEPQRPVSEPAAAGPVAAAPPPAPRPLADSAAYAFNIPALVGLTVDQIRTQLGEPISDEQGSDNEDLKTLLYRRKGYELSIDYEVQSRRLFNIYLSSLQSRQPYPVLLRAANATAEGGKGYQVDPQNGEDGLYENLAITLDSARVMNRFGQWVPDTLSR
ncbi:hypothetical protein [Hymenobacter sp.]|uniref:hypothetical protein n=1 Tax=Hymenobacter sp. TaxID=1898978 RepID=UPI00286BE5B1|nr:hypothetical protein [Hymenobacter sp.]